MIIHLITAVVMNAMKRLSKRRTKKKRGKNVDQQYVRLYIASSNAFNLIRTLRLSILLTDDELQRAEEKEEALELFETSLQAEEECRLL